MSHIHTPESSWNQFPLDVTSPMPDQIPGSSRPEPDYQNPNLTPHEPAVEPDDAEEIPKEAAEVAMWP
jgi:hypothetical protein